MNRIRHRRKGIGDQRKGDNKTTKGRVKEGINEMWGWGVAAG